MRTSQNITTGFVNSFPKWCFIVSWVLGTGAKCRLLCFLLVRDTPNTIKHTPNSSPAKQRTCALKSMGLSEYLSYFWLLRTGTPGNITGEDLERENTQIPRRTLWCSSRGMWIRPCQAVWRSFAGPDTLPPQGDSCRECVGREPNDWGNEDKLGGGVLLKPSKQLLR